MRLFLLCFLSVALTATIIIRLFSVPEHPLPAKRVIVGQEKTAKDNSTLFKPSLESSTSILTSGPEKHLFDKNINDDVQDALLPPALLGTEVPGSFAEDENGDLVINRDVRKIFDYFLMLLGTEAYTIDFVQEKVTALILSSLNETAQHQAFELFDRYLAYYEQLEGRFSSPSMVYQREDFSGQYSSSQIALVQQYYEEKKLIKNLYFTEEEGSLFFQQEETYENYMIERMKVMSSDADDFHKRQKLEVIEGQVPETFKANREKTFALNKVKRGSVDDLSFISETQKENVKIIETQRLDWREKKREYRVKKQSLLEEFSYYSEREINALMESYMLVDLGFNEQEIQRMKSLEGQL